MKPWTPKDDEIMRTNAGRISDAEIGKLTGHARETVARHRGDAGLPAYHPDRRNMTRRERLMMGAAGVPGDFDPEDHS
jgi:hypothetical protein